MQREKAGSWFEAKEVVVEVVDFEHSLPAFESTWSSKNSDPG